jgi:hypothetical protein
MVRYVLFLCLSVSMLLAQGPKPAASDSKTVSDGTKGLENQLVKNEKRLATSEENNDGAFLKRALADDVIYVVYNGWVFTKDKILRDVRYIDIHQYKMENFKVRQLDRGAALLTYDLIVQGNIAGHQLPHQLYAASVWVKKGSGWILVLHQETPAHHP